MAWTITATTDDASWFDAYVSNVLTNEPPALPEHDSAIGHVQTHWHQVSPGLCYIAANPEQGTIEDRLFAERIVYTKLRPYGYKLAAAWGVSDKVQEDAKRLVQSGAVHLDQNSQAGTIATVQGDGTDNDGTPDIHKVEIRRQDPGDPTKVTGAFCDCAWGQFLNTPRTRQWKRFQRVPCKHIVATSWVSQSVPQDESRAPGDQGEQGQMSLPGMDQSGGQAPGSMGLMQKSPYPPGSAWFMQPGAPANPFNQQMPSGAPQGMPPAPEEVLPQFPMDPSMMPQVNPASVPGGRPGPTPTNPMQYPGGTFSSYRPASLWVMSDQQFTNGDIVRIKQETQGVYVGRPESGMPGSPVTIQKGQTGHVRGVAGGLVEVLFMGDQFNDMGLLQPFGATAWCWPSELEYIPPSAPGAPLKRLW